jgi:4-aminobutyrate aminotransferase-like enzyme
MDNPIDGNILRFVFPLIITESNVDRAIDVLNGVMEGR